MSERATKPPLKLVTPEDKPKRTRAKRKPKEDAHAFGDDDFWGDGPSGTDVSADATHELDVRLLALAKKRSSEKQAKSDNAVQKQLKILQQAVALEKKDGGGAQRAALQVGALAQHAAGVPCAYPFEGMTVVEPGSLFDRADVDKKAERYELWAECYLGSMRSELGHLLGIYMAGRGIQWDTMGWRGGVLKKAHSTGDVAHLFYSWHRRILDAMIEAGPEKLGEIIGEKGYYKRVHKRIELIMPRPMHGGVRPYGLAVQTHEHLGRNQLIEFTAHRVANMPENEEIAIRALEALCNRKCDKLEVALWRHALQNIKRHLAGLEPRSLKHLFFYCPQGGGGKTELLSGLQRALGPWAATADITNLARNGINALAGVSGVGDMAMVLCDEFRASGVQDASALKRILSGNVGGTLKYEVGYTEAKWTATIMGATNDPLKYVLPPDHSGARRWLEIETMYLPGEAGAHYASERRDLLEHALEILGSSDLEKTYYSEAKYDIELELRERQKTTLKKSCIDDEVLDLGLCPIPLDWKGPVYFCPRQKLHELLNVMAPSKSEELIEGMHRQGFRQAKGRSGRHYVGVGYCVTLAGHGFDLHPTLKVYEIKNLSARSGFVQCDSKPFSPLAARREHDAADEAESDESAAPETMAD